MLVQGFPIPDQPPVLNDLSEINKDPMEIAMKKFKNQPNIKLIADTIKEV